MSDKPGGWRAIMGAQEFRAADEAKFENATMQLLTTRLRVPPVVRRQLLEWEQSRSGRTMLSADAANATLGLPLRLRCLRTSSVEQDLTIVRLFTALGDTKPGKAWSALREETQDGWSSVGLVMFWPRMSGRGEIKDGGLVIHDWNVGEHGTSLQGRIGDRPVIVEEWRQLVDRLPSIWRA